MSDITKMDEWVELGRIREITTTIDYGRKLEDFTLRNLDKILSLEAELKESESQVESSINELVEARFELTALKQSRNGVVMPEKMPTKAEDAIYGWEGVEHRIVEAIYNSIRTALKDSN